MTKINIFSFLRTIHTILYNGCSNLCSHQQCRTIYFSLTSSQVFTICGLFDEGHSDWYKVVPHYSFDLHFFNNVGHLFMCLLAICVFFLEKCLFRWSVHFSTGFFCIELYKLYWYIHQYTYQKIYANIFSHPVG